MSIGVKLATGFKNIPKMDLFLRTHQIKGVERFSNNFISTDYNQSEYCLNENSNIVYFYLMFVVVNNEIGGVSKNLFVTNMLNQLCLSPESVGNGQFGDYGEYGKQNCLGIFSKKVQISGFISPDSSISFNGFKIILDS